MSHSALFLDRDGVLNVDHGYIARAADFEPMEGVFDALRSAAAHGYKLIVITNQSGIGRGYFTQQDYNALESHIQQLFAAQGVELTATYHCPHHPDAGCDCRKPKPGMILKAARDHDIDLARSVMIGDKPSDMEAARAAGIERSILISSQNNINEAINIISRR